MSVFSAHIPSWLERFTNDHVGVLGSIDALVQGRSKEDLADKPWLLYLDSIAVGRGFQIEQVVGYVGSIYPTCPPLNLLGLKLEPLWEYFPKELCEKFQVIPVLNSPPFLGIATLEPELVPQLHADYNAWVKTTENGVQKPARALQFFLTTPSAFRQYSKSITKV